MEGAQFFLISNKRESGEVLIKVAPEYLFKKSKKYKFIKWNDLKLGEHRKFLKKIN